MSAQEETRRELGWLIYGIILGAILGLCINLWTSTYFKWLETTYGISDWVPYLIYASIVLFLGLGFLLWYALRILRT